VAGGVLTDKQAPLRPGIAPALGLRAGSDVSIVSQTTVAKKRYNGVLMSLVEVEVPRENADTGVPSPEQEVAPLTREVRHEYTRSLLPLLSQLGVSVLVSTYQAGKVAAVAVAAGELRLSYHNFERATGRAVKPDGIAVAARAQVWFLHAAAELAARVEPAGTTPAS
jgi:hypothetical protein